MRRMQSVSLICEIEMIALACSTANVPAKASILPKSWINGLANPLVICKDTPRSIEKIKNVANISTVMGKNIVEIKGNGSKVESVVLDDGSEIETNGVFVFVGTVPNSKIVEGIVKTENGFVLTDEKMNTSLPGLYAVGDVRNTSFRQVVTATGDGAKAAHSADEYIQENSI